MPGPAAAPAAAAGAEKAARALNLAQQASRRLGGLPPGLAKTAAGGTPGQPLGQPLNALRPKIGPGAERPRPGRRGPGLHDMPNRARRAAGGDRGLPAWAKRARTVANRWSATRQDRPLPEGRPASRRERPDRHSDEPDGQPDTATSNDLLPGGGGTGGVNVLASVWRALWLVLLPLRMVWQLLRPLIQLVLNLPQLLQVFVLFVAGLLVVSFLLLVFTVFDDGFPGVGGGAAAGDEASLLAWDVAEVAEVTGIPVEALEAYRSAALEYEIDWTILAAIGLKECDHGRSQLPGCRPGTANRCGARGPMQFLGNTWRRGTDAVPTGDCPGPEHFSADPTGPPVDRGQEGHGFATDGNGDDDANPWEWEDATHAAARKLVYDGVRDNLPEALFRYNPSPDYVDDVIDEARKYDSKVAELDPRSPGQAAAEGGDGAFADPATGRTLVQVACPPGGRITVDSSIADDVEMLLAAAERDGVSVCGWGYRSHQRQIDLRREHCGPSDYDIWRKPSSECSPPTARPGTSQHERGLAIDFTCNGGSISSSLNACFIWLTNHAATYGLYNLPSEPWHWSTTGG